MLKLGHSGIKEKGPLLALRQKRRDCWTNIYDRFCVGLYTSILFYALFIGNLKVMMFQQKLCDLTIFSVMICVTSAILCISIYYRDKRDKSIIYTPSPPNIQFPPMLPSTFGFNYYITYAWPLIIGYTIFVISTQLVLMSGWDVGYSFSIVTILTLVATVSSSWHSLTFLIHISVFLICYLVLIFCYEVNPYDGVVGFMKFNFIYILLVVNNFFLSIFKVKILKFKYE